MKLSVAIPTYRREQVLLDTLAALRALEPAPLEILVVDQTERHEPRTEEELRALDTAGRIRWIRLSQPSITRAMNVALALARGDAVLYLDDDIRPEAQLFSGHLRAHAAHADGLVAGRVIQPWEEEPAPNPSPDARFRFSSTEAAWVREFMGGNFSVRRDVALALGGFDENFVRVAYRFEAEFAHRYCAMGARILFEPGACIHHLRAKSGGTRTWGDYLATWRPDHAVGAYYFGLRTASPGVFVKRPLQAVANRFHLNRPWRIPITLWSEAAGMLWALFLFARGPRRLGTSTVDR